MVDLRKNIVLDLNIQTLEDYSGNSNNATNTGTSLVVDRFNRPDRARSFNGSSDYLTIPDDTSLEFGTGNISVSCWFKRATTGDGNWHSIISKQSFVAGLRNDNTLYLALYTDASNVIYYYSTAVITDLNWHHAVFVYNGSAISIYLDSVLIPTTNGSGGTYTGMPTSAEPVYVGRLRYIGDNNYYYYFLGTIAETKLFKRALSAEEVKQLYFDIKYNYYGIFDSCINYWDFNNDVTDLMENGYATIYGGPTLITDRFGVANRAYNIVPNQYINVVNSATTTAFTGPFTFGGWFKLGAWDANENIFVAQNAVPDSYFRMCIWDDTNRSFLFIIYNSATYNYALGTGLLNNTDWHFGIVTCNTNGVITNAKIDGVDMTIIGSSTINISVDRAKFGPLESGGNINQYPLTGTLGEFFMWNRELSTEELNYVYNATSKRNIYPVKGGNNDI